ncbi:hypothetical protein B0J13DRAFT_525621 [Dactylonectria estremocensis]|uniref:Uncharacterized protein n=1 Tax=Dactylonectria estremocensis TaxID=1079267 RepID=A0A9P9ETA6_9HYPO|nr:hypothetical protein B0J13DRAFT_525621 [Dactylonectria estremocensis]
MDNSKHEFVPMMVGYRVLEPDGFQIQWARSGTWYTNSIASDDSGSLGEPVVRRLTYKIFLATWIVPRFLITEYDDCTTVKNDTEFGQFFDLGISIDATPLQLGNETFFDRRWLDAFICNPDTTMRDGVAAFVRAAMSGFHAMYPTVIRHPAQVVYLAVGILAFLVGIVRIWLGPPKLTSWMGQHVYLALGGVVTISEKPVGLRSGYEVASGDLGRLRLLKGEPDLIASPSEIEMVDETSRLESSREHHHYTY